MTYAEWMSKATLEQRMEVRERVERIIGKKESAKALATNLTERIQIGAKWDKQFEALAKVFYEHGEKALAMNFVQMGRTCKGVTVSGKTWVYEGNCGWTNRSRNCGSLYIEGEGTVFTSGRIDKVFDYILSI